MSYPEMGQVWGYIRRVHDIRTLHVDSYMLSGSQFATCMTVSIYALLDSFLVRISGL